MADFFYPSFRGNVLAGDLERAPIRVLLVGQKYKPKPAHQFVRDVGDQVQAPGYAPQLLAGAEISEDGIFRANDVRWPSSSIKAWGAVLAKAADDKLVCYLDFGGEQTSSNGLFLLKWSRAGILNLQLGV